MRDGFATRAMTSRLFAEPCMRVVKESTNVDLLVECYVLFQFLLGWGRDWLLYRNVWIAMQTKSPTDKYCYLH